MTIKSDKLCNCVCHFGKDVKSYLYGHCVMCGCGEDEKLTPAKYYGEFNDDHLLSCISRYFKEAECNCSKGNYDNQIR